jgi:hypothetical protein
MVLLIVGVIGAMAAMLASGWQQVHKSASYVPMRSGDMLLAEWTEELAGSNPYQMVPIRLGYIKGLSQRPTSSEGSVQIDLASGEISVEVSGLESFPPGSQFQVWLVDNLEGEQNSVALDFGETGDRFLNLGNLPDTGIIKTSIAPSELAEIEIDMAAVVRTELDHQPELVIGGMQSIVYKNLRGLQPPQESNPSSWLVARAEAANSLDRMIDDGERLFMRDLSPR